MHKAFFSTACPILIITGGLLACQPQTNQETAAQSTDSTPQVAAQPVIQPVLVTQPADHDTDDPAIWIHPTDPAQSLVIGTDKDSLGALYVYDLEGKIIPGKVVKDLQRPNNVDVEYGLLLNGKPTDIAVVTERIPNRIRVFRLPDMQPVDNGGIPVFMGETQRAPMGIALYKRPSDNAVFAIVGRKEGPTDGYLWQYRLQDDGKGSIKATVVRKFGKWSGKKEIESIAVDDKLGYVYYSDETMGVRKYYADPDSSNQELALLGTSGFTEDHEGISIYELDDQTGYLLVSDQQAGQFHIFPREGTAQNPHDHPLIKTVKLALVESDGSEVTSHVLHPRFPGGLFVAMSDDKTFQYYAWKDLAGQELKSRQVKP